MDSDSGEQGGPGPAEGRVPVAVAAPASPARLRNPLLPNWDKEKDKGTAKGKKGGSEGRRGSAPSLHSWRWGQLSRPPTREDPTAPPGPTQDPLSDKEVAALLSKPWTLVGKLFVQSPE